MEPPEVVGWLEQSPLLQQESLDHREAGACRRGPHSVVTCFRSRSPLRGWLDSCCQEMGISAVLGSWAPGDRGWICLRLFPPQPHRRVFSDFFESAIREVVKRARGREGAALACQKLQPPGWEAWAALSLTSPGLGQGAGQGPGLKDLAVGGLSEPPAEETLRWLPHLSMQVCKV